MHALVLLHGIGSIGVFASRAFLPAFITALLLRYGHHVPWIHDAGILQNVHGQPTWFTHDITLMVLGALSVLEFFASRRPEAQELLEDAEKYIKTGTATLTYLGVLSVTDAHFIEEATKAAGVGDYLFSLGIALGVLFVSGLRGRVMSYLAEADQDDDVGLRRMIAWAEDAWVFIGLLIVIVFPIVMLTLVAIITGLLVLVQKYLEYREDQSRTPCTKCAQPVYTCAVACGHCGQPVPAPAAIGILGNAKAMPDPNPADHPYRLVEKRRCPVCATRLKQRTPRQTCPTCSHELNADPAFAHNYMSYIARRLPRVGVITALWSLIPVVGLIPGMIYYRFTLIAPFRRYIPLTGRIVLKLVLLIVGMCLIVLQAVPGLGVVALPIMAVLGYIAYRSAFRARAIDQP